MKTLINLLCSLALGLILAPDLFAQTTAFTYQGRLNQNGGPAHGSYDMQFSLFNVVSGGAAMAGPLSQTLTVTDGLFTASLDFGSAPFTGQNLWLLIAVRTNGVGSYSNLAPRQPITSTPYAVLSGTANSVAPNGVNSAAIQNGAVALAKLGVGVMQPSNFPPNSVSSVQLADSIALGSASAVGQLDVFRTAAGGPAISLLGSASQISTYGSDGLEQIRLWGVSYGEMQLFNNLPSNDLTVFLSANGANGGLLSLNNSNGNARASLFGGNTGGYLNLLDGLNSLTLQLNSAGNSYLTGGNVGIGTQNPLTRLDVFDGLNQNGTIHVGGYGANGDAKLVRFGDGDFVHVGELYRDDLLDLKGGTISMSSSFVGVGTTDPAANFHLYSGFNPATMRLQSSAGFGSARLEFWSDPQGSLNEWRPGYIQSTDNGGFTGGLGFYVNGTGYDNRQASIEVMRLVNGNVGIGTATPSEKLHVNGNFIRVEGAGGEQAYMGGDGFGGDVQIGSFNPGIVNVAMYNPNNGYMNLFVKSITISGGADLAEPFKMSHEEIPQGAVVVIDEENPGQLKMSAEAYDTHVAGIVSGAGGINPGIQLKQQGALEGGQNVALTGRVYALADASSAPIKPGDLLTTSSKPGHCMKAGDRARAQGAILGKAMTGLKEGQGKVLVLVTLQ